MTKTPNKTAYNAYHAFYGIISHTFLPDLINCRTHMFFYQMNLEMYKKQVFVIFKNPKKFYICKTKQLYQKVIS